MRKYHDKITLNNSQYKIIIIDDDQGIIDSLTYLLRRNGYQVQGTTSADVGIKMILREQFDILILDYLLDNTYGDQVVEKIRRFNKALYILLLTGHKDLANPFDSLRLLDIQTYCEKSDDFNQLLLSVESAIKSVKQLKQGYLDTIEALRLAVDAKDEYTKGHSDRVSSYAVKIGETFDLSDKDIETLRVGGIFHDIGKIGISDIILLKNGRLNEAERVDIEKHPVIGSNIIASLSAL